MYNFIYWGMDSSSKDIVHIYQEIEKGLVLGKIWRFKKKLFTKGSVGAVYKVEFEGSSVSYNSKIYPEYILYKEEEGHGYSTSLIFPSEYNLRKEENKQAEILKRNRQNPLSEMDKHIEEIRTVFKQLKGVKKSRFIGDLIHRITR